MSEFVFKLPDLGEGTVEAEIVEWHVKTGDQVREDDVIVDVMTDKANVEVPAPVSGTVVRTVGTPGDVVAVGAELIVFATGAGADASAPAAAEAAPQGTQPAQPAPVAEPSSPAPTSAPMPTPTPTPTPAKASPTHAATGESEAARPGTGPSAPVLTSPAIRRRAAEAGIDLARITGSGPRGRILRRDFEAALESGNAAGPTGSALAPAAADEFIETQRIIGVRRVIATRMAAAKRAIPHFSYVEEIDITALETLRTTLGARYPDQALTYLPFIALALLRAIPELPHCNAHFDGDEGVLTRFGHVHLGIAAQTPDGLKVPVVRHAQQYSLWHLAAEIRRVSDGAKAGSLGASELSGSTITLTSLGKLGGIASTPVINAPEVSIIGVNKAVERPVVVDGQIVVRRIMNLSGSFDHRIVDGFDAASLIAKMKALLEEPALLFLGTPS